MDNTELFLIPLRVTPAESDVAALERKRAALADDPDRFRFINPSLRVSFARRRTAADDRPELNMLRNMGMFGYPSSLDPSQLQNLMGRNADQPSVCTRCGKQECECGFFGKALDILAVQPSAAPSVADLYNELLYAVEHKYPGESRHDTALRYIRDRETLPSVESQEATDKGAVQPSAGRSPCACDYMSYGEYPCQSAVATPSDTARYYCKKTGLPVGTTDKGSV